MPLLWIWTKPTKTIHYLLEKRSIKLALLIWLLMAISNAPTTALNVQQMFEVQPGNALLIMNVISFLFFLIGWPICAGLFYVVGRMLKGSGSYKDVLWVLPAASIPHIWLAPVNNIMYLIRNTLWSDVAVGGLWAIMITSLIVGAITTGVWVYSIFIASKGLEIVHRFSVWRGFSVTMIIAGLLFTIFLILSLFAAFFILSPM